MDPIQLAALDRLPRGNFIDGEWVATAGDDLQSIDPATEATIVSVAAGAVDDVERAVTAARSSFDEGRWMSLGGAGREKLLWRIADMIDAEAERIACLEVLDNGMPLANARFLVSLGADTFRYYAGWCTKLTGMTADIDGPGRSLHAYTAREPVGVAALIVPWNVPFIMACKKIATALAAGCSVILKPAEETPLSALVLADIIGRAGVPPGVFNLVNGLGEVVGAALSAHHAVDKVGFTGSTAVGRKIVVAATGNMKQVSLELGGKSPAIVMPDADIAAAVEGLSNGAYANSGQACIAGSRIYVHRSVAEEVADKLVAKSAALRVGNGFEEGTDLGPLISLRQMERVLGLVRSGVEDGGEILSGGERVSSQGFFVQPTVMMAPPAGSRILREEIFGPVATLTIFDDAEEAIDAANDTEYGLAASLWTRNIGRAHRFAKRLRAGTVWLNCSMITDKRMPFGGYKQSGWGRESALESLDSYLQTKSVFAML